MNKSFTIEMFYDEDTGEYKKQVFRFGDVPEPPPVPDVVGVYYNEGIANVVLKNAGSTNHPSNYRCDAYYVKIGRRVFLDMRVYFLAGFASGSGDEFWLDVEGPSEILPDFTGISLENAGVFHAWGGGIIEGNSYWSTNVGSGLDGIRVTVGNAHVSRSYPRVWGPGDHWRITIDYNA